MKFFLIIITLLYSFLTEAQIERTSDTLEIWTLFSSGNFVRQNAERIVEKQWPFKIKGVAGDAFAEELVDSAEAHNNQIWTYLDTNGYTDAKRKFQEDLLAEINRIKQVVYISNSDSTVSNLFKKLRKNERQNYVELNKLSNVEYEIVFYSFDVSDLDKDQSFEMRGIVNLNEKNITIKD